VTGLVIPDAFARVVSNHEPEGGVEGSDWLRELPRLVQDCLDQWDLEVVGRSMHGMAALVLPVRRTSVAAKGGQGEEGSADAMLKVVWPHPEAAHEHLALRRWDGHGAVRLLAADPSRWALLLERLDPARTLLDEPIDQACTVIGQLLHQLDGPALSRTLRLSDLARRWASELDELAGKPSGAPVPPRFLRQASDLALDLAASDQVDDRLVHADLHYENVLGGAARQPWLAIDPQALAGEPAYAVAPALWNRWGEALGTGNVPRALRHRLELVCDAGGIDPERARAWSIVREAVNAMWEAARPTEHSAAQLSAKVVALKALQPD
jgi:streptomycin 6-kinase